MLKTQRKTISLLLPVSRLHPPVFLFKQGLSFKPETDDMRDASSITVINELTAVGAKIKAYDPKAMDEAKDFY